MIPVAEEDNEAVGTLAMLYDTSFIDVRLKEIWKDNLMRFLILSILVVFSHSAGRQMEHYRTHSKTRGMDEGHENRKTGHCRSTRRL